VGNYQNIDPSRFENAFRREGEDLWHKGEKRLQYILLRKRGDSETPKCSALRKGLIEEKGERNASWKGHAIKKTGTKKRGWTTTGCGGGGGGRGGGGGKKT